MSDTPFSELDLIPQIERAVVEMGFDITTPIQAEAIPLIRTGADVIARSQTGTGKTIAFGIPAIEIIDTKEEKPTIQVLILCPTRELAMQGAEEIRKISRFMPGIRPVEIFGGAPIDKQCIRLRRANIVIGTPGRVMDHMRRKTIRLNNLKMIVLDEADEMLNMGFKEDIETILTDTPENRQTLLFSATMPPAIMAITNQFQKDPQLIEINKNQVTIEDIEQTYIDVPHNRKKDALATLISYHKPNRAIIFCNTKKMVDELTELLSSRHISAESIHSDIGQSRRTSVMHSFKTGKTAILIATDIAARGIDVSDVDFVINYDIPPNTEYYIHRIGRTGRAGKSGRSITICGGKREVYEMRNIAREIRSEITQTTLPTQKDIQNINIDNTISAMEEALNGNISAHYLEITDKLVEKGYTLQNISAAAMQLNFAEEAIAYVAPPVEFREPVTTVRAKVVSDRTKPVSADFETVLINVGSSCRVAANHILGAVTERTSLVGRDVGKIDIFADHTVVEIPAGSSEMVIKAMEGCKINGNIVNVVKLAETYKRRDSGLRTNIPTRSGYGRSHNHGSSIS